MISIKTIANRFLSSGVKPRVTLNNGAVHAGYGIFSYEKNQYEIPVMVLNDKSGISFQKWDLDNTPIVAKMASFSFVGTVHELETLCQSTNAKVEHHLLLDEFHMPAKKEQSFSLAM